MVGRKRTMYGWEVDGEHNALGDLRPPRAAALVAVCSARKKIVHDAESEEEALSNHNIYKPYLEVSEVSDVPDFMSGSSNDV
jgi:hypothetical protein